LRTGQKKHEEIYKRERSAKVVVRSSEGRGKGKQKWYQKAVAG
jgi:hypothetical protein